MEEFWSTTKAYIKRLTLFIKNPKTKRQARISYSVAWNITLLVVIVLLLGGIFAGGTAAGYFASLVKDEPIRPPESMKAAVNQYEETSKLYFAGGEFFGKLQTDIDRERVKIKDVSDDLKNAIIATEDEYFYDHEGIVPKALMRAIFQEMTNSAQQTGGSTLTQQLIKNQILTDEVSFDRKAKEILLAMRLENFLGKDEILEAYLNVTPFGRDASGQNIGGIQAASKGVFGVDAKDLTLPQAAFLAGMPKNPFSYTPFANGGGLKEEQLLEPGLNRMKTVLYRMRAEEYISEKQYQDALAYDIKKDFIKPQPRSYEKYPWLTVEVENRAKEIIAVRLAKEDGYTQKDLEEDRSNGGSLNDRYLTMAARDVRKKGYHIHSTVDKGLYDQFQRIKDEYDNYGYTKTKQVKNETTGKMETVKEPVQVGAILIENKTGRILSFVGGRDHALEELNHATQAVRPNGSTMKPLLVYAPAMEMGLSAPGAVVADVPISVSNGSGSKVFKNYLTGRYYGLVSSREALAKSYNASAIYTYLKTVDKDPAKYLEKMGMTTLTEADHSNLSAALGGLEQGVTLEENANAYTTFANGGKFKDAYMIDKITDPEGNVVYEHQAEEKDVFSPQTAYLMTDMMRDVFKYGTASAVPGMLKFSADWAGKTGTTTGPNDAWLIGSNPNVTFGTWIGYDQQAPLSSDGSESRRNYGIWAKLINGAYDVNPELVAPDERFKQPEGIVSRSYCAISGLLPSKACSDAGLVKSDIYNAKFVPTKKDDSLGGGKYVVAGGKSYAALPSTPEEFTRPGGMLSPEFTKRISLGRSMDLSYLIPKDDEKWKGLVAGKSSLKDNGKAPAGVRASISDGNLTWAPSSSSDVIGYRVFTSNGKKVASVMSDAKLSVSVGSGSYYVVAVDIAGRESAKSAAAASDAKKSSPKTDKKHQAASSPKKEVEKPKKNKPESKPEPSVPPKKEEQEAKPGQDGKEKQDSENKPPAESGD